MNDNHNTLADFLKSRRDSLKPNDVGLIASQRRRVPGLRREEVATLAGLSPDYYQRIEQGRIIPSIEILRAIARGLQLDEFESRYLLELGNKHQNDEDYTSTIPDSPNPYILNLLHAIDHLPAYVLDHRRDLLAWNSLGGALCMDLDTITTEERNMALLYVFEPKIRALFREWEEGGRIMAGHLRHVYAKYPHDKRLNCIIKKLLTSEDFRYWWSDYPIYEFTNGTKRLEHPLIGTLDLDFQTFTPRGSGDQELYIYIPRPGSKEEESLKILASWTKTH